MRESDANAEALLAIRMAILDVVVADFFVGKGLERFGNVYPVIVDRLYRDILRWVLLGFIRMQRK